MKNNLLVLTLALVVLIAALTALLFLGANAATKVGALTGGTGKVDPIYGRCHTIIVATSCTDVPLSAIAKYGGITFPRGSKVISSSSSGKDFFGGGQIQATIRVPGGTDRAATAAGTVSPNNRISYDAKDRELMTVTAYVQADE